MQPLLSSLVPHIIYRIPACWRIIRRRLPKITPFAVQLVGANIDIVVGFEPLRVRSEVQHFPIAGSVGWPEVFVFVVRFAIPGEIDNSALPKFGQIRVDGWFGYEIWEILWK